MLGSNENPGIIFRTVMELYRRIEVINEETDCEVIISYLEIYNETVIDLINPGTQLQIREDGKMGVNIPGISRHRPSGPDDLLRLLQFGNGNRTQHPTDANKESSRSHAVFQVFIKQTGKGSGLSADVKVAKLSMIDLAGSERGSATSSRGLQRFREGANINKSLLALGNCINALAEGSKYIPYRNSKLTRLLKDSIGGNCRTVMISNVTASSMSYEDTYNTLRYADRAKKIKVKLKKNVMSVDFHVAQYAKIVEDLKKEITDLKVKIAALEEENDELRSQPPKATTASINSEEAEQLKSQLADLLDRQKDYDDLQARIEAFEKREEQDKAKKEQQAEVQPETETKTTPEAKVAVISPEMEEKMENYLDLYVKFANAQTNLRLLMVRREFHQRKIDRFRIVNFDTDYNWANNKVFRIVKNLDRSIVKLKRRNAKLEEQFKAAEKDVPEDNTDFNRKKEELKSSIKLEHSARLAEAMYHEQNRTEAIVTESLTQLATFTKRLYGSSMNKDEQKLFSVSIPWFWFLLNTLKYMTFSGPGEEDSVLHDPVPRLRHCRNERGYLL